MKTALFLGILALNASAAVPVLVRITPETLARLQARDPMIRVVDADNAVPMQTSSANRFAGSTVLHDGRNWTLVPNGSLVRVPASMKGRVNAQPVGNLLPWTEFLAKNHAWISTNEVTFDQAAGNEEVPVEHIEAGAKPDKIIVAVHRNGPAMVRVASRLPSLTSR